jgi:uncharacterized protein
MGSEYKRRDVLKYAGLTILGSVVNTCSALSVPSGSEECGRDAEYLPVTLNKVPFPRNIEFRVQYSGKSPITLAGHYWYNADALSAGKRCPAIVELNPYRRRDGLMYADSMMYPWFAANGYLCFRVDLQGSGDSEGIITDEYTDEELSYCVQVIEQIAKLPICDGNVGMMGKSWSAINSLMVSARDDCPPALKAIVVCCGTDDRYNDDVHYMGGAMMLDNIQWPSSMWGWLALPPDPVVVQQRWKEMWRQRIRQMNFWFETWAGHQSRDRYWSETSVHDHADKVKVPVFVLSGWQDGYKNAAERVVRSLGQLGRPVSGIIGPWGHKYPFDGYPGPRLDWLRYITDQWWDRWLKGKQPDAHTAWPQLTVWLGESREPTRVPNFDEKGKWIAEDGEWMSRTKEAAFYFWPGNRLSPRAGSPEHAYVSRPDLMMGTAALETSSWGSCANGDLPGDESGDDLRSIHLDSEPLAQDLECFGYPVVNLNLECDKPRAVLAIRLSEVSPETNESHLVTYRFFNLCYREGDMANPKRIPAQTFAARIPLNIAGHVFKRRWSVRLSISPFLFPTMWQSSEIPTVKVHTRAAGGLPDSMLSLPVRMPRAEDVGIQRLLRNPHTTYVDPENYVPTVKTLRSASSTRTAQPITVDHREGTLVKKVFDSGSTILGGALDNLLVDQMAEERIQVLDRDPLSTTFLSNSVSILVRGDWKTRAVTETRVWSERIKPNEVVFRYEARVQAFISDQLFEEKHVEGTFPRLWV